MAIQFVGQQSVALTPSTGTNTTINFALSGGLASTPADGDLVVVLYVTASNGDSAIGVTTAGYAEITELFANSSFDTNLSVSWKLMGSTPDTSVVVSPTGSTADSGVVTVRVYRGVDATTPFDVAATTATATSINANPPAITPVTAGAWIVALGGGAHNGNVGRTYSFTGLVNTVSRNSTTGTYDVVQGSGDYTSWTSGAYDPSSFTTTSATGSTSASVTLALRPSASATHDGAVADTAVSATTASAGLILSGAATASALSSTTATAEIALPTTVTLAGNEGADTISISATLVSGLALAAMDSPDTASFAISALDAAVLLATETADTAAVMLSAKTVAALGATEISDTASVSIGAWTVAEFAATESIDTADFSVTAEYRAMVTLQVTEEQDTAAFAISRQYALSAAPGNYTVTGYTARLYESSFFYTDNEVVRAPQETNYVLVRPAAASAEETVVVPAEVQQISLDFEDREIEVPASEPIEELAEDRESAAEARLRTA